MSSLSPKGTSSVFTAAPCEEGLLVGCGQSLWDFPIDHLYQVPNASKAYLVNEAHFLKHASSQHLYE